MKRLIGTTALSLNFLLAGVAGALVVAPSVYAQQTAEKHQTTAVVENVDAEKGRVMLAHDPVPTLEWPAMTMGFSVEDKALLKNVKKGQKIAFTFVDKNGKFVVTDIEKR